MVINYKSKDFIGQTRYTTRYIRDKTGFEVV